MEFDAFVSALFERARAAGIESAEVYYASGDSLRVFVRGQKIEDYTVSARAGLSFRGVAAGRMGYASTEALDEAAIDLLVAGVKETAALIDSDDVQDIFPGSPSYEAVAASNASAKSVPVQSLIDRAMSMEQAMEGEGIQVDRSVMQLASGTVRLVNTYGLSLSHTDGAVYAMAELVARRGERTSDGYAMEWSPDLERLDTQAVARASSRTCAKRFQDCGTCTSSPRPTSRSSSRAASKTDATSPWAATTTTTACTVRASRPRRTCFPPCRKRSLKKGSTRTSCFARWTPIFSGPRNCKIT